MSGDFNMNTQEHRESMYASPGGQDLRWTQPEPRTSLSLIGEVCPAGRVIDVGGGTSLLAKMLLVRGYSVAVMDLQTYETYITPSELLRGALSSGFLLESRQGSTLAIKYTSRTWLVD